MPSYQAPRSDEDRLTFLETSAKTGAAEVAAVLATARLQAADVPTADRAYVEAQQAIAAQRPRADELIADIMADLRSSLRKYDEATQRRIMRTYGATFISLPGEPADPEAPVPTSPSNPPSGGEPQ